MAKVAKPTDKDKERAHELAMKKWDVFSSLCKYVAVGAIIVGALYVGIALPVNYSSGQQTTITYLLAWAVNADVQVWIAWGVAGAAAIWAGLERAKRLRERKERDERLLKYETVKDPNRTSSGLTLEGKVAPEGDER